MMPNRNPKQWTISAARTRLSQVLRKIIRARLMGDPIIYPTYCVHLAIALSELGKPEEACDELQMAVNIDQFGQETRRINNMRKIIGICS